MVLVFEVTEEPRQKFAETANRQLSPVIRATNVLGERKRLLERERVVGVSVELMLVSCE